MDDFSERTLEPTQRRLRDAREEGHVARSADFAASLALAGGVAIVWLAALPAVERFAHLIRGSLGAADLAPAKGNENAPDWAAGVFSAAAGIALPLLIAAWLCGYAAHVLQVGWLFAPGAIQPRLSRLNPVLGLQRILSGAAMVKTGFDILKILAVLGGSAAFAISKVHHILLLPRLEPGPAAWAAGTLLLELACWLALVLLFAGAADLGWQKWKQRRDLRMNAVEAREELRQSEGDPFTRRRRRAMQARAARGAAADDPSHAQVVLTDGGDLSLAIRYDAGSMHAPAILATGRGAAAARLRTMAAARGIPVIERRELASAIALSVPAAGEVPPQFYQPLAEILAGLTRSGRFTTRSHTTQSSPAHRRSRHQPIRHS